MGQVLSYPTGTAVPEAYTAVAGNAPVPMALFGGDEAPQAQAVAARGLPAGDGLVLRPRTAVSIGDGDDADEAAAAAAPPREQIGSLQFDVLHKQGDTELPISKATRTLISAAGKAVAVRDRNVPAAKLAVDGTEPEVEFEAARKAAVEAADPKVGAIALYKQIYPGGKPVLTVLAGDTDNPRLEVFPDAERKAGKLVWRFSVASADPARPFVRRYWVAARGQPVVVSYEDRVFLHGRAAGGCVGCDAAPAANPLAAAFAPAQPPAPMPAAAGPEVVPVAARVQDQPLLLGTSGFVTGLVWKESPYQGGLVSRPLAGLTVTVKKGAQTFTTTTNGLGVYHVPAAVGPVQVTATLAGPMAEVQNLAGPVLAVSKVGVGLVNLAFTPSPADEAGVAQVSAFQATNAAFNFARSYLPANPTKLTGMLVRVNINDSCNAFYTPGSTNYFRKAAGASCPNTAYADVVSHEYGHAVDDQLTGIQDGGYSEGFGDALCLLITRQPGVGRNSFGPPPGDATKTLRDASSPTAPKWPAVQNGEVHQKGFCYSAFCWRLITKLKAKYANDTLAFAIAKRLVLGAGVLNPNSVPDAARLMFFVDKQAFPQPAPAKSKHYDLIKAAADEMQIPHPQNPFDLVAAAN